MPLEAQVAELAADASKTGARDRSAGQFTPGYAPSGRGTHRPVRVVKSEAQSPISMVGRMPILRNATRFVPIVPILTTIPVVPGRIGPVTTAVADFVWRCVMPGPQFDVSRLFRLALLPVVHFATRNLLRVTPARHVRIMAPR